MAFTTIYNELDNSFSNTSTKPLKLASIPRKKLQLPVVEGTSESVYSEQLFTLYFATQDVDGESKIKVKVLPNFLDSLPTTMASVSLKDLVGSNRTFFRLEFPVLVKTSATTSLYLHGLEINHCRFKTK